MQHYVDVGAAVADVDHAVMADLQLLREILKHGDFSVAGGDLFDDRSRLLEQAYDARERAMKA